MAVNDELLDVVNELDQVIATRRRGDIHALGLMHRAVHILVFDAAGEVFIQQRSLRKDENPGLWDSSAAGHVDSGETYLDCAHRELEEELGVTTRPALAELFRLAPRKSTGMEHCRVYRCNYDGEIRLQREEVDQGIWLDLDTMDRRVASEDHSLTEVLRIIWRRYRELAKT